MHDGGGRAAAVLPGVELNFRVGAVEVREVVDEEVGPFQGAGGQDRFLGVDAGQDGDRGEAGVVAAEDVGVQSVADDQRPVGCQALGGGVEQRRFRLAGDQGC